MVIIESIKRSLDGLDSFVWKKLTDLDKWSGGKLRTAKLSLDKLDKKSVRGLEIAKDKLIDVDRKVRKGGSKNLTRKRTGNRMHDFLSNFRVEAWKKLDRLDAKIWFKGRHIQAKACRVRSEAERKIANYLTEQGIKFRYEKKLKVRLENGKIKYFRPDFYLVDYEVYLEYWGMMFKPRYRAIRKAKELVYQANKISYISLEQHDLKDLGNSISKKIHQATGKSFP